MKKNYYLFVVCLCSALPLLAQQDPKPKGKDAKPEDVVLADDYIVQGSICSGFDCVNNEAFGFSTIKMKENNTRLTFEDTSVGAFPSNDWTLTANSSESGGQSYFEITDVTNGTAPFRVRAQAPSFSLYVSPTGNVGVGTDDPQTKMHVNGDLTVGNIVNPSDRRLKTDIQPLEQATALIAQLAPKTYRYRSAEMPNMGLPTGPQFGLIAQDVEKVLPTLVNTYAQTADGASEPYKGLNYVGLIPILVRTAQEQQETILQQQAAIAQLQRSLADLQAQVSALATGQSQKPAPNAQAGAAESSTTPHTQK